MMTRPVVLLSLLALAASAAACEDPPAAPDAGPPPPALECPGDSFLRARLELPGEAPIDTGCLALEPLEVSLTYRDFSCVLRGGCGDAIAADFSHELMFCGRERWFDRPGRGVDDLGLTIVAHGPPLCGPPGSDCTFHGEAEHGCWFDVVQTGSVPGDVVEVRLSEACDMVTLGGDGRAPPRLLDMRLRGHLRIWREGTPDAGLECLDGGAR